jgi:hypothetical protein
MQTLSRRRMPHRPRRLLRTRVLSKRLLLILPHRVSAIPTDAVNNRCQATDFSIHRRTC